MTDEELETLEGKLRAREGLVGYRSNVDELKDAIEAVRRRSFYKDRATGRFVTEAYARANPSTTYRGERADD